MATKIGKVNNDVSAPNPKKDVETTKSLENLSDGDSAQPKVDEGKDGSPNEAVTDVKKKMKRAERFGMPVKLSEEDKRNSRAERFGSVANSNGTGAVKGAEDQKRKARAERFGIPVDTVSDEEAKKKARLAKFAAPAKVDNVEDDKRKARALRFSVQSNEATSNVNGTGKPEQITAVEGNVGGAA